MKLLALASSCVVLLLQAPPSPAQQLTFDAGIEGTVTRLGSAEPVPGTRVTIVRQAGTLPNVGGDPRGAAPGPLPPVITDSNGHFSITGLTAGIWNLQFLANGYVSQPFGQRGPNGPGSPITVAGGQ